MLTRVGDEELADGPEMGTGRRGVLADARDFLRGLLADRDHAADPAVRRELSLAHRRLGKIHVLLGQYDWAEDEYRQALGLLDGRARGPSPRERFRMDLAVV